MSDNNEVLHKILDMARWAPSGDNTQPWRFEVVGQDHIAIHGYDTREWCVYDFEGRASYMAHGALLETMRIAATEHKLHAEWSYRIGTPETAPIYDVRFKFDSELEPDRLLPFIKIRTVFRRPMQLIELTDVQRELLSAAPGLGYKVEFFESLSDRLRVANLLWNSAYIRLTCPEAYHVHKEIIEWGARFSKSRIPEQAVGVDSLTAKLMRWVMRSWERLDFFNRYLFGTIIPRVQLDFLPAIFCSTHISIKAEKEPQSLIDFVSAGIVMQKVWLTCAANGLLLQPQMTPIIFNWYASKGVALSYLESVNLEVTKLSKLFDRLINSGHGYPIFLCRVGVAAQPYSRSVRKELEDLMWLQK